jgi:hypothetical protein
MATNNDELLDGLTPAPDAGLNPDKYEGSKVKIEKISVIDKTTDYDENGNYVKGLAKPTKALRVETAVLEIDTFGKELRCSQDFGLKATKTGAVVWSTHKKALMPQLLAKFKVNSPKELVGKEAVLIKKTNPETGKSRLVIVA